MAIGRNVQLDDEHLFLWLTQMLCVSAVLVVILQPVLGLRSVRFIDAAQIGNGPVLLTFLVATSLFAWHSWRRGMSRFGLLAVALAMLAPLVATVYARWLSSQAAVNLLPALAQPEVLYLPYRALLSLWLVALMLGLGVRIWASDQGKTFSRAGESLWVGLAMAVGGLAVCTFPNEPNLYWPASQLSLLALIMALSAVYSEQPWRGHVAAMTAGVASWFMIAADGQLARLGLFGTSWLSLWGPVWVAVVALACNLARQRTVRQHGFTVDQSVSIHLPIATGLLSCLALLFLQVVRSLPPASGLWIVGLSAVSVGVAIGRLWDMRRGRRGLAVYLNLISLASVAAVVGCCMASLPPAHTYLVWLASLLGAMAVMSGLLREALREHSRLEAMLRLGTLTTDTPQLRHAAQWMSTVHLCAALLALVPSILLVLTFQEQTLRVAATVLPFLGALAILPISGYIANQTIRYAGMLLISSSLVLLWWAELPSAWATVDVSESWIYWDRLFVALITLAILYPTVARLRWQGSDWEAPLVRCGWMGLLGGMATGAVLLFAQWQTPWGSLAAQASAVSKVMTVLAWLAATARLLQFAVSPFGIEQSAPTRWRKSAVYAAELSLACTVAAGYFHYPELFSGMFAQWWPLVLFLIAMLSAGLGEWLRRIGQVIVADPVSQNSLLLPVIPLVAVWWIQPGGTDWQWNDWSMYAFLLLSAAGVYALHGWLRDSVGARAASGLFMLLGFWSFLHSQSGLQFVEHPQFWLLPPALAMLGFIELNRLQLEPTVVLAGRYVAVLIAYLSSSVEMIFTAFDGQLWQPLLLLILALAGAAAGILLQVRAFLYCGSTFVAVALVGMVWHAQQAIGQVWPWWVFGIVTGVCLIAMLGYFEKNRLQVLAYLEQLKHWEK